MNVKYRLTMAWRALRHGDVVTASLHQHMEDACIALRAMTDSIDAITATLNEGEEWKA